MKKVSIILTVFLLIPCFHAWSQRVDSTQLFNDLYFLSLDSLEGRRTESEGNKIARQFIKNRFEKLGLTGFFPNYVESFTFLAGQTEMTGKNIIGYMPGNSDLVMVISAHFDHLGIKNGQIYNGADDNASGTAALLAIAAYFAENPPEHTVIFAAFDAEEMGLKGAKAFVQSAAFEVDKCVVNVNMDMISRSSKNELIASGTLLYPFLKSYVLRVKETGLKVPLGYDKEWAFSSDHGAFHREKIPYIYFGVLDHPDYHKATDDFDKVDMAFYEMTVNYILNVCIGLEQNLDEIKSVSRR